MGNFTPTWCVTQREGHGAGILAARTRHDRARTTLPLSHRATWLPATFLAAVLVACTGSPAPPAAPADGGDAAPSVADEPVALPYTVVIDGSELVLVAADGQRTLVALVPDEVELVHASVRPGDREPVTVLALTREEDRYELRYADVRGGEVTDLYWFPYRLQVSERTVDVVDVPTLPVWSPDGDTLAWLEWDDDGTRLRTVGWLTHDTGTNPSEDQAAYDLDEVPVGTQLATWEVDDDGVAVLTACRSGTEKWRIRLEEDGPIAALGPY